MRQQTEVSPREYDAAAGTDAYQWLAYGRPQGSGPYQVPLRDLASRQWQAPPPPQAQFRPAAIPGQRPAATPPHLAPVPPEASRRASDRRLALAVALVFLGLFCLVGAWWLHTAHATHAPAGTLVSAPGGQ
jgi:hypothetical protein